MEQVLEVPGSTDSGMAGTYNADTNDDTAHPDMGTYSRHDQVGGNFKDHITHVKYSHSN